MKMNASKRETGRVQGGSFGRPDPDDEHNWIDDGTYITVHLDDDRAGIASGRVTITWDEPTVEHKRNPLDLSRTKVEELAEAFRQAWNNNVDSYNEHDETQDEFIVRCFYAAMDIMTVNPAASEPTDAEIEAAARALAALTFPSILWDDLHPDSRAYTETRARAALVAAREEAGR